jgi:hypothetical protein
MTKIVSVLYDNIPENLSDIRNNLIDLTNFKMHGTSVIDIYITNRLSDTLDGIRQDIDWAVVVAAGNWLEGQFLLEDTVNHAIKENSPLACHILAKGGYYHFHDQWFAIHLPTWRAVGSPRFEESPGRTLTVKETIRDENNVHDDYTPWWIKPGDTVKTYTTDHGYFGLSVIEALINNNHLITNIPQAVRNRKSYPYPDANYQALREMIADPKKEFPQETTSAPVWWFKKALDRLTENLDRGFYVVNTEPVTLDLRIDHSQFDCFVGVCGGIKPACIVGGLNTFRTGVSVHLFDVSQAALDWQRYLIEKWDGDIATFESVYKSFMSEHPDYFAMYLSHLSIEGNIDWYFKSGNITKEEFQARWKLYCIQEFSFHKLNLLEPDAANQILKIIGDKKRCYLWTSNSFFMDYLMFYKTEKVSRAIGESFKQTLQNQSQVEIFYEECNQIKHILPSMNNN